MIDVAHLWGGDLMIGATGDLATVTADTRVQQRVLRRLLTNAGDYIWQLTYGAGLPAMVGAPMNVAATRSVIRSQIFNESGVAQVPEPVIAMTGDPSGSVQVSISYADAISGVTQLLALPVGS